MAARDLEADRDTGSTYRDAASSVLQELDSEELVRIFTDIDELDRQIGGFRAGELVLFTAGTGVGKTLLAQQTRRRSCRDGRHTLFCSTLQRLYGSGAKARHSSIVLYVDRPYVQELAGDETEACIVIAKNRDGKVGAIDTRFNVKTLRFESLPKTQPEQPDWVNR